MAEKEKKAETPVVEEVTVSESEKKEAVPKKLGTKQGKEKDGDEPLFGMVLIFCLALILLAILGYFGYVGYRMYRSAQAERAVPSIDDLSRPVAEQSEPEEKPEEAKTETPSTETAPETTLDKKTLSIKILNGGAQKGTAGTYAETLKKVGYTQTTLGNSFGSYTGVTIYHATGKEKEAATILQDVVKTYPKAVVKVAPAGDKDATAAPYVVILGQ